jgi:O-antigen/teichoic acid export membrane protein
MGIIARQSIKASIVTYAGAIIGFFNVLLITPYCLPPEIVGLSRIFLDAAMMLALIAQIGITSGLFKFFPEFRNQLNNLRFLSFILPLSGFIIVAILFILNKSIFVDYFSSNSALFNEYIAYTLPFAFILIYLNVVETFSNIEKRIVVPSLIKNIILKIINIAVIVLFYLGLLNVGQFVISILVIYGLVLILNIIYLGRISSINILPDFSKFDKPLFFRFLKYILFVFAMGLGTTIASKVDVFMISSTLNLAQTGIFTIAFYIITVIEIPSKSLLAMTYPMVAEYMHENKIGPLNDLYKKSSLIQLIVGGILLLLVWINIDSIFEIMPNGEIYEGGKYVVLLLGINKIIDMATGINSQIIITSKLYAFLGIFLIFVTIATIGLNYLLIPIYGITGSALATLISIGVYNILLVFFLKQKMGLFPFGWGTVKILGIVTVLYVLNLLIPNLGNPYIDGIVRSSAIVSVFAPAVYFLKLSPDINRIIEQIWNFVFSRLKR